MSARKAWPPPRQLLRRHTALRRCSRAHTLFPQCAHNTIAPPGPMACGQASSCCSICAQEPAAALLRRLRHARGDVRRQVGDMGDAAHLTQRTRVSSMSGRRPGPGSTSTRTSPPRADSSRACPRGARRRAPIKTQRQEHAAKIIQRRRGAYVRAPVIRITRRSAHISATGSTACNTSVMLPAVPTSNWKSPRADERAERQSPATGLAGLRPRRRTRPLPP